MSLSLCSACQLPSGNPISTLPCAECLASLLVSPQICRFCLGLSCSATECLRPWMRVEGENGIKLFDSVTSRYLSLGPGAGVLKSWKKSGSPALHRHLASGLRETLDTFFPDSRKPLLLLPIPQSSFRKWQLNGGSVLRLCEMIQSVRKKSTILECLELFTPEKTTTLEEPSNQARTKGDGRYARKMEIRVREHEVLIQSFSRFSKTFTDETIDILLVDDFLTSGATLRSALTAVRLGFQNSGLFAGRRTRIGAFVLGFRPSLFSE